MPKKIDPKLKRTLELHIRISPIEKKRLDKQAKEYRSLADYIRERLFQK